MFKVAQYIVRHKVGATAVLALGVFFMMPNQDEEVETSNNPWAVQSAPSQRVQAEEQGFVDQIMDEAVAYLDENDMNPLEQADEAVGRLDETAAAYSQVNDSNGY